MRHEVAICAGNRPKGVSEYVVICRAEELIPSSQIARILARCVIIPRLRFVATLHGMDANIQNSFYRLFWYYIYHQNKVSLVAAALHARARACCTNLRWTVAAGVMIKAQTLLAAAFAVIGAFALASHPSSHLFRHLEERGCLSVAELVAKYSLYLPNVLSQLLVVKVVTWLVNEQEKHLKDENKCTTYICRCIGIVYLSCEIQAAVAMKGWQADTQKMGGTLNQLWSSLTDLDLKEQVLSHPMEH